MDLTQSLLTLTKVAEKRRVAVKDMTDAVAVIARTILEEMDTYDVVKVSGHTFRCANVTWEVSQWANEVHAFLHPEGAWVLTMDGKALFDPRSSYFDGNNRHSPVSLNLLFEKPEGELEYRSPVRYTTPDEDREFCAIAADVITAFAAKISKEADETAQAVGRVAKLAVK